MKKFLLPLLLVGLLWSGTGFAQTTTFTPNLNLGLPPAAPGTWGAQLNQNFTILDGAAGGAFAGNLAFTADISPAQITANQNDYNPTDLTTASTLRLSTDASRNITGIAGGSDGRLLLIHNIGSFNVVLVNASSLSADVNRFALSGDLTLGPSQGVILQYDSTSSRWRASRVRRRRACAAGICARP